MKNSCLSFVACGGWGIEFGHKDKTTNIQMFTRPDKRLLQSEHIDPVCRFLAINLGPYNIIRPHKHVAGKDDGSFATDVVKLSSSIF